MAGWQGGREATEGGDRCKLIADSLCNIVKQLSSNKEIL